MKDQPERITPIFPNRKEPWWNDGDKIAGLATTIILLTAVIVLCTLVLIGTYKLAQWIL